ncbi:hypothetical protein JNUCC1_00822 [Lentibacillus sp. JNUCC-1]|nr:hypothetical protein [Lentibacillus sp. JNUCC-1]
MKHKDIKTALMYKYFIDAAVDVINEEGIERVTVKKVARKAGFTASTVYNYFDEFSHLIYFSSMRFLNDYNQDLQLALKNTRNPLDKYLSTWQCFFRHSFASPGIFNALFVADLGSDPNKLIHRYYNIYQSDLSEELKFIIMEHDMFKRNRHMLEDAADQGFLQVEDIEFILGVTVYTWQGKLTTLMNNRSVQTGEEAEAETIEYVRRLVGKCALRDVDAWG